MDHKDFLLRVLNKHVGKDTAMTGAVLLATMNQHGFRFKDERALRDMIHTCRQEGELICSSAGTQPGYYMAASRQEYDEFADRELLARIRDMAKTISAMRRSAQAKFGKQRGLGI